MKRYGERSAADGGGVWPDKVGEYVTYEDLKNVLAAISLYSDDLESWSQVVIDDAAKNIRRIIRDAVGETETTEPREGE